MAYTSQLKVLRGIVQLVIVNEQSHGSLELVGVLMASLSFVGWHNLWLFLSSVSGCFRLLSLLLSFSLLLFLAFSCFLDLRVPVHVQTIGAIRLEEHLHEVSLQLILGDGLELGNLLRLPIEVILMSSKLTVPHP